MLKKNEKCIGYVRERTRHIFNKLVKETDRVSIMKYHTRVGVKVECSLILKKLNHTLLEMELEESVSFRDSCKKEEI